jgi:hypothetical protein
VAVVAVLILLEMAVAVAVQGLDLQALELVQRIKAQMVAQDKRHLIIMRLAVAVVLVQLVLMVLQLPRAVLVVVD